MLSLNMHVIQIWLQLHAVYQQLPLIKNPNPHILFRQIRIASALNHLSLSL